MNYDPEARCDTPLARNLAQAISATGPMRLDRFLALCMGDSEHGYYRRADAIGREGDFVTAPEISQIFGELIGLWAVVTWQQMGQPDPFNVVELGPGRGTLLADALRAAGLRPQFLHAARLHLVEINETLRERQRAALSSFDATPTWHAWLDDLPEGPSIIIANEFLDTLPCRQWVRAGPESPTPWLERHVDVDASGRLTFVDLPLSQESTPLPLVAAGQTTVFTTTDTTGLRQVLGNIAAKAPLVALFIDYGQDETSPGDTLQAVRGHQFEHPLTAPGWADLSTTVDFAAAANSFRKAGLQVDGPRLQADFLGRLGIAERASRLMAANPIGAATLEAGVARLMSPAGMGGRFKVMAVRSPGLAPVAGLEQAGVRQ